MKNNIINIMDLRLALNSMERIDKIKKSFDTMLCCKINSKEDLEHWIEVLGKVNDEVNEVTSRDYADFQCHNDDENIKRRFSYDQEVLLPLIKTYSDKFDRFIYNNEYKDQLGDYYNLLIKRKKNSIDLFREENIALEVEEDKQTTAYYDITGNMTVMWKGEEKTLQQMAVYMKDGDRNIREEAWKLVQRRRLEDAEKLDEIMNSLVKIRDEKASNAGLSNFRDYMFKSLERFDYTPEDCEVFHEAVRKYVVPLKEKIEKKHEEELNIKDYRPWDMDAVPLGQKPLKPYEKIEDLIDGVIRMFERTDEFFADTLKDMKRRGTLDLESRKAKSPGGFCDYFPVSNIPFIFMNGAHSHDDMVTLAHEGGHSVHDMLKFKIKVSEYKNVPSESAELASMSMELITMDKWDELYKDEEDLKRAKREHLEGIIKFLPWAMTVDKFQHWIYLNPKSSAEERNKKFAEIAKDFVYSYVDWSGYEEVLKHRWKAQLHIYEVPFYYIEYAISQLGALQVWREYKKDPVKAIENYKKALALGSSKPLKEIYEAAGIKFDFSERMIKELMEFTWNEIEKLY